MFTSPVVDGPIDREDLAGPARWTVDRRACDPSCLNARLGHSQGTIAGMTTADARLVSRAAAAPADDYAATVAGVAGGSTSALTDLYDATVGKVHALVRSIIRNPDDAEEVTCDVYTYVWQNATQFDPTRGVVMSWLLTIARSRALDALRRQRTRSRLTGAESLAEDTADLSTPGPDHYLSLFQSGSAVHRALAALPADRRRLIGLAFFGDLSHAEISAQTGLPIGTVKSQLRRALHTLRDSLYAGDLE